MSCCVLSLGCREEKTSKLMEHLLASLNSFCSSPAVYSARGRLSQLGVCVCVCGCVGVCVCVCVCSDRCCWDSCHVCTEALSLTEPVNVNLCFFKYIP